jgi:hypothetical protein
MPPSNQTDEGALLEPALSPAGQSGEGPPQGSEERSNGQPDGRPAERRSRRAIWLAIAGAAVAVVAAVLTLMLLPGGTSTPGGTPGTTPPPRRAGFVFPLVRAVPVSVTGRTPVSDVGAIAANVRAALSGLYDQTIVDPERWASGPPPAVWNAFAPALRSGARADAAAFTLGETGRSLKALTVTNSSMTLKVLVDAGGHATAVEATISLEADAALKAGGSAQVVVSGRFFLTQVDGQWLINGYPSASVDITPSPVAVPSSASPSSAAPSSAAPGATP